MVFSHDRLVVYQHAIEFVAWSHTLLNGVDAVGSVRTQLERAATSIPLNIAEGNVKSSPGRSDPAPMSREAKIPVERIVSMLVKLVQSTDAQGGREGERRRARTGDDDND